MARMRRCGRRHMPPGTFDLLSCVLRHHFLTYLLAFLKSLTWLRNVSYDMISTADRWYSHRFTIVTTFRNQTEPNEQRKDICKTYADSKQNNTRMKDARLRVLRLAHRDDLDPATAEIHSADPFRVELRLPVGHQRHLNAEMTPRYDTRRRGSARVGAARAALLTAHRARDDRVRDGGIAVGPLTHEGPQNCDRLEGLAQAHVVGKDAPGALAAQRYELGRGREGA